MSRVELWTFGAVVLAGAAFVVLERCFPYNRDQKVLRTGFWIDFVLYCFVQSYVMGIVIGRIILALDAHTKLSRLGLVSGWPVLAQLGFFLVTHDLYIYAFHRLQHRTPLLWRLHEAHHSVPQVDWLSGVRSHAFEILINQTVEFAPILLLGAAPQVAVLKGAISAIWGMFIHSNLDVRLGKLQYVINGPEMHRWHHAEDRAAYDKNFSTKLAVWDWLFGTAYFPDPGVRKAGNYGLAYTRYPEQFPLGYFIQQALAFRRKLFPTPEPQAAPDGPRREIAAES
ncbi:MAG TPA: sterol desaturase family protein [Gemmatimonadales bacterium]|nr:sterol desaturase family protein [Gemmatimonadales bacterium]